MIPLTQAYAIIDAATSAGTREEVPVAEALQRVLVEGLTAPSDVPAFPRSAMDGFALRSADIAADPAAEFQIIAVVAAGQVPQRAVQPGQAVQVMTGAQVPEGADLVIRVEVAEQLDGRVRFTEVPGGADRGPDGIRGINIVQRGENAAAGDVVVTPRLMGAHDVGVAAAHGYARVPVLARPRVAVISTGDEIQEPGTDLAPGHIYNSNASQLMAHAAKYGCSPRYYGIAPDEPVALREKLQEAVTDNDIVLLSGGVSKGEFDYVPQTLADLGVEARFHRVAVKPGRPTYFGVRDDGTYVFGLPGNPVSVFVTFEIFVVRLLFRMAGIDPDEARPAFPGLLGVSMQTKDPRRTEFVPVRIENDQVHPVRYGGSSHLSALSSAQGLVQLPSGSGEVPKGTTVHVRPL
jgi:molybdopterin molybdotransferase